LDLRECKKKELIGDQPTAEPGGRPPVEIDDDDEDRAQPPDRL
jgi:hypothetical protein